jgi:FkbM family methyltransferase
MQEAGGIMKRLWRKAIVYYHHDGMKEVGFAFLRKILWHPRSLYRHWLQSYHPTTRINIEGLELHLNPKDFGLSLELATEGIHEPLFTKLLSKLIRPGMTVVDIGGNIGYYALLESKWVGPSGKVIVFEPAPESFELLKANIQKNKLSNVHAYQLAVGETRQRTVFYLYKQANWNSLVRHAKPDGELLIDVYPLDELLRNEPRVDLIRMDIEGYECQAINGMKEVLVRHKPIICVELHCALVSTSEVEHFLNTLRQLGYEIRYAIQRIKDEAFWGKLLTCKENAIEQISIEGLLNDERVTECRENFSLVLDSNTRVEE